MTTVDTLQAIVETAVASTGATAGWLLAPAGDDFELVTVTGTSGPVSSSDPVSAGGSYAAYVLSTTQPVALQPRPGDTQAALAGQILGSDPVALIAVPCPGEDDVVGVLELVRSDGLAAFDFDDVEIAGMVAQIAGPALEERGGAVAAPDPAELAGLLDDLARADPARYRFVAEAVLALLAVR